MDSRNSPRLASSLSHINQSIKAAPSAVRCEFPSIASAPSRSPHQQPRDTEHVLVMCRTRRRAPRRCPVKPQPPPTGPDHHRAPWRINNLHPSPTGPRLDLAAAAWLDRCGLRPRVSRLFFPRRLAGTWGQRPGTAVRRCRTSCLVYVCVLLVVLFGWC